MVLKETVFRIESTVQSSKIPIRRNEMSTKGGGVTYYLYGTLTRGRLVCAAVQRNEKNRKVIRISDIFFICFVITSFPLFFSFCH